jgi:hypothetical protein
MKIKINLISATIVIALAIGITAYAHGPGGGSRSDYGMGERSYGMMGEHGMMGGYGSRHGMMGGYGHNENGHNSRDYRQNSPNFRSESESLINEIEERRKELSSLLLSNNANKALIDKKVEELNRLERYLDERIQ